MTNAVAPLTTFPLGAPAENAEAPALLYRLEKSFAVVHFELAGKGRIVFLPEGAELRMVGSSCLSECFEVAHQGQAYHIFKVDLLGPWSMPLKKRANRLAPARPVGVCA
jgi:hypothetical protein